MGGEGLSKLSQRWSISNSDSLPVSVMLYDVFDIFVYASYDGMRYSAVLRSLSVKQAVLRTDRNDSSFSTERGPNSTFFSSHKSVMTRPAPHRHEMLFSSTFTRFFLVVVLERKKGQIIVCTPDLQLLWHNRRFSWSSEPCETRKIHCVGGSLPVLFALR